MIMRGLKVLAVVMQLTTFACNVNGDNDASSLMTSRRGLEIIENNNKHENIVDSTYDTTTMYTGNNYSGVKEEHVSK